MGSVEINEYVTQQLTNGLLQYTRKEYFIRIILTIVIVQSVAGNIYHAADVGRLGIPAK